MDEIKSWSPPVPPDRRHRFFIDVEEWVYRLTWQPDQQIWTYSKRPVHFLKSQAAKHGRSYKPRLLTKLEQLCVLDGLKELEDEDATG